ncbi:hypothetical protein N7460_007024, partial [Penicillium canescens]
MTEKEGNDTESCSGRQCREAQCDHLVPTLARHPLWGTDRDTSTFTADTSSAYIIVVSCKCHNSHGHSLKVNYLKNQAFLATVHVRK